ncbi:MAG TPA: ABC transporter permease [Caulobacterales bacterium]|nr:ABC transporter permease [Caulobacterales bacterium]
MASQGDLRAAGAASGVLDLDAVVDLVRGVRNWRTSYAMGLLDIELRYKRSLLGPFWISASLVVSILALSYLFGGIFGQSASDYSDYTIWLGSGLVVWTLISALLMEGCNAFVEHGPYLQNVPLPLSVIALRVAIRNGIIFLHNFVAVAIVLVLFGARFHPSALLVFPSLALILAFGFCVALALGPLCARFRDVPQVVSSGIQVLFFMTPIIWRPEQAHHRPMLTAANPFYHMIELIREPMRGQFATPLNWQVSLGTLVVAALFAVISLSLSRKRVALWL